MPSRPDAELERFLATAMSAADGFDLIARQLTNRQV
jgi:hypothetical protein